MIEKFSKIFSRPLWKFANIAYFAKQFKQAHPQYVLYRNIYTLLKKFFAVFSGKTAGWGQVEANFGHLNQKSILAADDPHFLFQIRVLRPRKPPILNFIMGF